jgi:fibronectin-binding autotransporter adhesin
MTMKEEARRWRWCPGRTSGRRLAAALACALACCVSGPTARAQLTTGLQTYFDFESGTISNVVAGTSGYTPTITNTGTPVSGFTGSGSRPLLAGNALNLIRSENDYFTITNIGSGAATPVGGLNLGGNFTLSAWHYLDPAAASLATNRYFVWEGVADFDVSYGTGGGTSGPDNYTAYATTVTGQTVSLQRNTWNNIVQVFSNDGTNITGNLYINGQFIGSNTTLLSNMNWAGLRYGNSRGSGGRAWDGTLDEIGIWNTSLTGAQAQEVYIRGLQGTGLTAATSGVGSWSSSAATNSWTAGGNWTAGTVIGAVGASAGSSNAVAIFGGYSLATGLGIDMSAGAADGALGVGAIVLDSGSGSLRIGNSSADTNGMLQLNGATTGAGANTLLSVAGSSDLVIANSPDAATPGTTTLGVTLGIANGTISIGTGRTATIESVIGEATAGSGFTKTGTGTLVLAGSNAYTGPTAISGGTLALSGQATIEASSGVMLTATGTGFDISAADGSRTIAGLTGAAGSSVTLGANSLTVGAAAANTFAGGVGGTGGLIKAGTGTLTLSGFNTYTGGTIVEAGTLQLNVGGPTGTVRGDLTIESGATVLANAGNSLGYAAGRVTAVTINGGTLDVAASGDQAVWGATVTMTGGTIDLTNAGARLALGGDGSSVNVPTAFNTLASATSATISGAAGSEVSLRNVAAAGGAVTFTIADGAAADDLLVSVPIGGPSRLVKEGAGTMRATSGSNTFSGGLTVNGGTFAAASLGSGPLVVNSGARVSWTNSSYAIFSTSAITLTGGVLSLDGTGNNAHNFINRTITLSGGTLTSVNGPPGPANDGTYGNFILNNSTLVVSGSAQSLISTTTLAMAGSNSIFDVGETGQDVDLRVTAAVNNSASTASTLRKTGAGTMELTRANGYSGGTIVNAGTLRLSATGAAGSGAITINGGTVEIASNDFNVFGGSMNAVTIGAGGTLLANNTSNNATNVGALTLNGGTLSSNSVGSSFGNFVLRNVTTGGSARSTIESNSIMMGSGSWAFAVADAVAGTDLLISAVILASGTTGITKAGAGTMELAGVNTYTGGTTISAGTLIAGNSQALGTAGVSIAAGGTLLTPAGVSVSNTRTLAGGTLGFTSNAAVGTVALLAAGSAGAPQTLAPTTDWASEIAGVTYSDVLSLTNTAGIAQVLTMDFDPTGLDQATLDLLQLGRFDPGTNDWVNAIEGNTGGTPTFFSGSWAEYLAATPAATPANSLGVYGRDTVGNSVWAVVNHNSDFAVIAVPEPTTWALVVGAAVTAGLARRRARSS